MDFIMLLILCMTVIALGGITAGVLDGRRKHRVELKKEDRRMVEAQTKQLEARNRQAELEYQAALAELERFDRRRTGSGTGIEIQASGAGGPAGQLPAGQERSEEPADPA